MDLVSDANRLNRECHRIWADVPALRRSPGGVSGRRPFPEGLFAAVPLFVDREHSDVIERLIGLIENITSQPPQAQQSCCEAGAPLLERPWRAGPELPVFERTIADMFRREFELQFPGRPLRHLAGRST